MKDRIFTKNWFGWKYRAQQAGGRGSARTFTMYDFKSDAIIHARVFQKTTGGEWEVYRIYKSGTERLVKVIGGNFDDWPGDDW